MKPFIALPILLCAIVLVVTVHGQAMPYAPINNIQNPLNNPQMMQQYPINPINVPYSTPQSWPNQNQVNMPNGYQFPGTNVNPTLMNQYPGTNVNPNLMNEPTNMMMPGNMPIQFPNQQQQNLNLMQPNFQGIPGFQSQPSRMSQPTPAPGVGIFSSVNDATYTTQQFRPPSRPQFSPSSSSSLPSFPSLNLRDSSIPSPSLPSIEPSVLNSMANTLSRSASQLSSIPTTIMQQAQGELAQSAAAAGMSTEQAQSILQEAMQRGASILTPPRPKPTSCDKMDFECQFYSACYSCYSNRNQPQCMWCVNLDNCAGDLACQTQRACDVCQRLPKSETKPSACDLLKC